jgi:hypothetical protein
MISFWCRIEWPSLVNYFFCLTAKILVLNDVNTKQRDIILYQKKIQNKEYSTHKTGWSMRITHLTKQGLNPNRKKKKIICKNRMWGIA